MSTPNKWNEKGVKCCPGCTAQWPFLSFIVIPPHTITYPLPYLSWNHILTRPRLSRKSLYHSRWWTAWRFVKVGETRGRRAWRWAAWRQFLIVSPATRTAAAWWRFATIRFAVWDRFLYSCHCPGRTWTGSIVNILCLLVPVPLSANNWLGNIEGVGHFTLTSLRLQCTNSRRRSSHRKHY